MILILTNSFDDTTDLMLPYFEPVSVFRFNIDLWADYSWAIHASGFEIRDPLGRVCRESEVGAVWLRKLFFNPVYIDVPWGGSIESWRREELRQIWEGIQDLAYDACKLALVHPSPTGRWNKMRQMRVASRYFEVPPWFVVHGSQGLQLPDAVVAKSFAQVPIGNGASMLVNRVTPMQLDPAYHWFLQEEVKATHDVTVVYVNGRLFAFETPRDVMKSVDSRLPTTMGNAVWKRITLSPEDEAGIFAFMKETGLSYSRLDFLSDGKTLWFLEMNANGQFAWLDIDGSEGLLPAMADEVLKVHDRHLPRSTQPADSDHSEF